MHILRLTVTMILIVLPTLLSAAVSPPSRNPADLAVVINPKSDGTNKFHTDVDRVVLAGTTITVKKTHSGPGGTTSWFRSDAAATDIEITGPANTTATESTGTIKCIKPGIYTIEAKVTLGGQYNSDTMKIAVVELKEMILTDDERADNKVTIACTGTGSQTPVTLEMVAKKPDDNGGPVIVAAIASPGGDTTSALGASGGDTESGDDAGKAKYKIDHTIAPSGYEDVFNWKVLDTSLTVIDGAVFTAITANTFIAVGGDKPFIYDIVASFNPKHEEYGDDPVGKGKVQADVIVKLTTNGWQYFEDIKDYRFTGNVIDNTDTVENFTLRPFGSAIPNVLLLVKKKSKISLEAILKPANAKKQAFCWEILDNDTNKRSADWSKNYGDFQDIPEIEHLDTKGKGSYKIHAWGDSNGDKLFSSGEKEREAYVLVVDGVYNECSEQKYGFDNFTSKIQSWKSVLEGDKDVAWACISESSLTAGLKNEGKTGAGITPQDLITMQTKVTVNGALGDKGVVSIVKGTTSITDMGIAAYPWKDFTANLRLVILQGKTKDIDIDTDAVRTELKEVYKQAVVRWTVIRSSDITLPCDLNHNGGVDREGAELDFISENGKDPDATDSTVFIISNPFTGTIRGRGENPGKYSWIFTNLTKTVAHELGHNKGLGDRYNLPPEVSGNKDDPENVMSNYMGEKLRKDQWDTLHR